MFVGKKMSKNLITIGPDDSLEKAMDLMKKHKIRRLPVMDGDRLVGIVTDRDVREAWASDATTLSVYELKYLLDRVKIKEIMTKQVITITPRHTIEEAAKLMYEWKISGLPVLENGKLVGIITESDIFKIFLEVMGWGEQGTRIEILVDDKPGVLAKISSIIKEFNVNIVSIVTAKAEEPGKRILIMRIKTENPEPVINEIQSRGYHVLSVVKG